MKIKKLKEKFFLDNPDLANALYDKNRGYGIVLISYNSLTFGIPLHSNIDPKKGFVTLKYQEKTTDNKTILKYKGLNYQKAVLIIDENEYIDRSFKIPAEQFDKIVDNKTVIQAEFEKYVMKFKQLHIEGKQKQLEREYSFSTLVNYKADLDIK